MTQETEYQGIYLAYFSAALGNSIGIFLFSDGKITGADVGGGVYDGNFEVVEGCARGSVRFRTTSGGQSITGANSDLPVAYDTEFTFPLPLQKEPFHKLNTIAGPVNVRFEKVREI